jgi:hypothetical protein
MLLFGRFAAIMRGKHEQRRETFEFLGFRASRFLQKLARENANLFVHWRLGMIGTLQR